jgi:hypothetical protein
LSATARKREKLKFFDGTKNRRRRLSKYEKTARFFIRFVICRLLAARDRESGNAEQLESPPKINDEQALKLVKLREKQNWVEEKNRL